MSRVVGVQLRKRSPTILVGLAALCAAMLWASAHDNVARAQSFPGGVSNVFVVVMENHNWSDILGNPSAAYITSLLTRDDASYARQYFNPPGIHPSEPNYIWMEAGQSNNLPNGSGSVSFTTDNDPSPAYSTSTTDHLTTYLNNAGITWKSYAEGASGTSCPLSYMGQNEFEPDHVPFVFFQDVTGNNTSTSAYCIAHIRPFSELASDLANNTAPRYSFITPASCHNMHDVCAPLNDQVAQGDAWLASNLPTILNSQAYLNGGAVFLTWDEGENDDGPIGMIVLSPAAKGHGYTNAVHYDHSSLLRSLQEIFKVGPLLRNAANATDLSDLFKGSLASSPTPTATTQSTSPTATATGSATPTASPTQARTNTPTATATATQVGDLTASSEVVASSDDAEEAAVTGCSVDAGSVDLLSSDLELVNDCYDQVVGMRFTNLAIPQGATISNASIQFTVKENTWTDATSLTFKAEATPNSATFAATPFNVSARPRTASSVLWKNVPVWTTLGATAQTPDLSPIVQEVVNQNNWASGNALSIIVTGGGHRTACSRDGVAFSPQCAPDGAPKLSVSYRPRVALTNTPTSTSTATSTPRPTATATSTTRTDLALAFAEASQQYGSWTVPGPYALVVNWPGSPGARPLAVADAPVTISPGVDVVGPTISNASAQYASGGSLLLVKGSGLTVHGVTAAQDVAGRVGGASATIGAPVGVRDGDLVAVYIDAPNSMTAPSGWTLQRQDGAGSVWTQIFASAPASLGVWTTSGATGFTCAAVAVGGTSVSGVDGSGGGDAQASNAVATGSVASSRLGTSQ